MGEVGPVGWCRCRGGAVLLGLCCLLGVAAAAQPCAAGSCGHANGSCVLCAAGRHSPMTGLGAPLVTRIECLTTLPPVPGLKQCLGCQQGHYSSGTGQSSCTACPGGQTTAGEGMASATNCHCEPGHYLTDAYTAWPPSLMRGCVQNCRADGTCMHNDTSGGALLVASTASMTVGYCNERCSSDYIAVQHGMHCYCISNSTYHASVGASASCTTKCSGNPSQSCGGAQSELSVYSASSTIKSDCSPCPVTQTNFGYGVSAVCAGGYFPPVAAQGYWAESSHPITFVKAPLLLVLTCN
jgi:hypothetical protein